MAFTEFVFHSTDGEQLYGCSWLPDGEPKAVMLLIHGMGEHSGRYAHVAKAFTDAGVAVYAMDLRGHGKSGGRRGHAPSAEAFMGDIDALFGQVAPHFAALPRLVYAHSMGSVLATYYILRQRPDLRAVILTGLALRTALQGNRLKLALIHRMAKPFPKMTFPTALDANGISRDPQVVDVYRKDPLVHGLSSLGMAYSLLQMQAWIWQHASEWTVPLLLIHGEDDPIAYASASRDFAALVKGPCTCKIWSGLLHEVHNEPEQGEVLALMLDWLKPYLP